MKLWAPNQQLQDGRFIIEKILGGGGYGVTYSAREQRTGNLVAIKTLNHIQQSKPDFRASQQKFVNEALRLARCSHPHIVQVYELIEEDGLWGMVMEYIHGEDLGVHLEDRGVLEEAEALRIIGQIGDALTSVHKQNFLHRDVKPQNIILRNQRGEVPPAPSPRIDGDAVLIDFGLAREFITGQMQSMTNQLTECFAPIEQYSRRGEQGAYTDVYALAATLYNLITGEIPIPAKFRQSPNIPLVAPKQHNPSISDRVNEAIIKGMELAAQNRPQSVIEWLGLLMPTPSDDVKLISAVGMDYTTLRDLLAAGKWSEADRETALVMLKVAGREKEGWFTTESIEKFPCEDLRTIDQLWVKYSNGRYGFSVQQRIYQSLGGTESDHDVEVWIAFVERVGWIRRGTSHLPGHLPMQAGWGEGWEDLGLGSGWFSRVSSLAWRLVKCNI